MVISRACVSSLSAGHFVVTCEINLFCSEVVLKGSESARRVCRMGAECPAPLLCSVFTFVNPHFAISDPSAVMFYFFLINLMTFSPLFL